MGCHGRVPAGERPQASESSQAQRVTSTRSITNQQIVDALTSRGSLNGAAGALGINPATIVNRSKSCAAIRDALGDRPSKGPIDMTTWGQDGWKVLRQAPGSPNGRGALWVCEHHCGGVEMVHGTRLRNNPNKFCHRCRPKKISHAMRQASAAKEPVHG